MPSSVEVAGALFADGTSAGDAQIVTRLVGTRKAFLSQLELLVSRLSALNQQQSEISAVITTIDAMQQEFAQKTTDGAERVGGQFAYHPAKSTMQKVATIGRSATSNDAIPITLRTLEDHIKALRYGMAPSKQDGLQ